MNFHDAWLTLVSRPVLSAYYSVRGIEPPFPINKLTASVSGGFFEHLRVFISLCEMLHGAFQEERSSIYKNRTVLGEAGI